MKGAKDADYSIKRLELLGRVRDRLALAAEDHPSFRQLAESASVSQATLRHYFGDLSSLIAAVLEAEGCGAAPYLAHLSRPSGPFDQSVREAVQFLANGQRRPSVRAIHAIGNAEGMRRRGAGSAYRTAILDPVIDAVKVRLDTHVGAGEMRPCDTRVAAIALCAPVFLFFQHQVDFEGATSEAIDLRVFLKGLVEGFILGYRA